MGLEGESPAGVVQYRIHTSFHVSLTLHFILRETRLKESIGGCDAIVLFEILTEIDHLQFIALL